tara:strand:+ start:1253 stop:1810 length:558 start_codon:yes stop_codon:yes gene_type:complete
MAILYNEGGTSNTGRIIQIVQSRDIVRRKYTNVTNNTFYRPYTNLDTTITPKLASSKLIINIHLNYGIGDGNAASVWWQLREGSTTIEALNGSQSDIGHDCFYQRRWMDSNSSQMEYYMDQACMVNGYIDAGSTSARTYRLYFRVQGSGYDLTINRDGADSSDSSQGNHSPISSSYMTVMEVSDV